MTAEAPSEPPTLGEVYWNATGMQVTAYAEIPASKRRQIEAGAAAVAATAVARLGQPAEPSALGLKHAVTSNRLGHALAALREIAEPCSDEFPRDTARNALDDDAAIRDGVALTREPQPAPEPPGLRAALVDAMLRWSGRDAFDECASDLARILDQHPQPQPAPELAACEAEIASLTDQRNRVSDTADRLRAQLRAVRAVAEPYAGEVKVGASSTTVLAQAVLDQLGEDDQ